MSSTSSHTYTYNETDMHFTSHLRVSQRESGAILFLSLDGQVETHSIASSKEGRGRLMKDNELDLTKNSCLAYIFKVNSVKSSRTRVMRQIRGLSL